MRISHHAMAMASLCLLGANAIGQTGTIRIGSWNIEHLGDPGARRGSGTNVRQKPDDLARYIAHAGVDLLAVQEIKADGEAPKGLSRRLRTSRALTQTCEILSRKPGQQWQHALFPKMRSRDASQWTGVMWNQARLKQVGQVIQIPVSHARSSQRSNLWDRNVYAIKFSAGEKKTDFLILSVHLKANTRGSFARHREEEIKELVRRLPTVKRNYRGEEDLIILGDTNIQSSKERAVVLLQKEKLVNLNGSDLDTHTAKGSQPFDRIFVPSGQKEFSRSRLRVLSDYRRSQRLSFAAFRARYSDHYIITTELQVLADDD